ncbi:type I-E CRISPR-associated protein Cse2/CasB [Photobacterium leiognathi]|uniref:type I-E CRISPR-associated protein Cse2/CasB n=1 Tax=Photobacterium leiognathi TaxID=553611 RepID=UPI001EDDDB15|nr:type I-E CRISPR-associated protein Cse2/CasB [Photobacterium leiognathi]MCG3884485.1 type I-E CRISPR-associated protein Cse2/CasB [Photobacterium leiognathi]
MHPNNDKPTPSEFVEYIFDVCKTSPTKDNLIIGNLRNATNPSREYLAWEVLIRFGVNIGNPQKRIPYLLVASFIAKSDQSKPDGYPIGKAIAKMHGDNEPSKVAEVRLRSILSCISTVEVCKRLKPILVLIQSKGIQVDYRLLLEELCQFEKTPMRQKTAWATQFHETN